MSQKYDGIWIDGAFSPFYRDIEVCDDQLPVILSRMFGDPSIPLGLTHWYKNPARALLRRSGGRYDDVSNVCAMKGSKLGISTKDDTQRVDAYYWAMAYKYGKRLGDWYKKTGKLFLCISGEPCFLNIHHSARNMASHRFYEGFNLSTGLSLYARHGELAIEYISGITLFACLHKADGQQRSLFKKMLHELYIAAELDTLTGRRAAISKATGA